MGKYDASGKRDIHLFALAWAQWLLEREQIAIEAELSGEFQIVARSTDVLLQVRDPVAGRFLSLTELQLLYDVNLPRRLTAYGALAREKYQLDVYITVVYLRPPPQGVTLAEEFHSELMGQIAHQDFRVIRLWELSATEALALNNPALLPFVPLMRGGNTAETLRQCVRRVRQEPEADELEALLALFAGLVMNKDFVKRIVGWNMQHILEESPLYQELVEFAREMGREKGREEGLEKGREEGLEKGREEGRYATLAGLRRFLAFRYHTPDEYFDARLRLLDLPVLQQLFNVVANTGALTRFEEILSQLLPSTPTVTPSEPSPQPPTSDPSI